MSIPTSTPHLPQPAPSGNAGLPLLRSPRLLLCAPQMAFGAAVADFYQRNAAHFAPWDPPLPDDHASLAGVAQPLADAVSAFADGRALRWWLRLRQPDGSAAPGVIGSVHLSAIARGPFHSANLGYALDAAQQGRGLMREALQAVLAEGFSSRVNLHRVQAGVRPENGRSMGLLWRLGFAEIGLAHQYLFIDGDWRDHILFERINGNFQAPDAWSRRRA